jgi:ribonuclease HII
MNFPKLIEEKKLWKKGYKGVACLDEVGRGPVAGPVVAVAVLIKISNFQFPKIKDSKKLSPKKREEFYNILTKHPNIEWGIGRVSEKKIDKINILEATKFAMIRAIEKIKNKNKKLKIDYLILDGNFKIDLPIPQKSIIKADGKIFSCAAASIIAKVTRDKIMRKYHKEYPCYGFDRHKGYLTKLHWRTLKKYGQCKIHRKSFKPVLKVQSVK